MLYGVLLAALCLAVVVPFAIGGAVGGILPFLFVFASLLAKSHGSVPIGGVLCTAMGFILFFAGVAVALVYHSACGTACPEGCPFPVPELNHHGAFHIIETFAIIFYCIGASAALDTIETAASPDPKQSATPAYTTPGANDSADV